MSSPRAEPSEHGVAFWFGVAIGGALMGVGIVSYLDATPDWDRRINFAVWLVGIDLAHDAIVAPLACLGGLALTRFAPPSWRGPVQAGLFASACVLLVAAAPLRDTAAIANNATIQPLDYPTATLTVLSVVWCAVVLWGVLATRKRVR